MCDQVRPFSASKGTTISLWIGPKIHPHPPSTESIQIHYHWTRADHVNQSAPTISAPSSPSPSLGVCLAGNSKRGQTSQIFGSVPTTLQCGISIDKDYVKRRLTEPCPTAAWDSNAMMTRLMTLLHVVVARRCRSSWYVVVRADKDSKMDRESYQESQDDTTRTVNGYWTSTSSSCALHCWVASINRIVIARKWHDSTWTLS